MRIVLEAGACHGDLAYARRTVEEAGELARLWPVSLKVQLYRSDRLVVKSTPRYDRTGGPARTQDELFERALTLDEWELVFAEAREAELDMFATPFDMESLEALESWGVRTCKVASGDITYHQLIEEAARRFPTVVLSTGASTGAEIADAVNVVRRLGRGTQLVLLACTLSYPAALADANLERVRTLQYLYRDDLTQVGYSDHTPDFGTFGPLLTMGADMVEKHFTLERGAHGDDLFAVTPASARTALEYLTAIQEALGTGDLHPIASELDARAGARRSCVAAHPLARGQVITAEDVVFLRPGTGVPPCEVDSLIGRELAVEVAQGQAIQLAWLKPGGSGRGRATASLEVS